MSEQPKILFASTNYGPLWAPAVESWLATVAFASRFFHVSTYNDGASVALAENRFGLMANGITDRMYTHSAENAIVNSFLHAEPKLTHVFLTESDMILPHDTIPKLLAVDQPVVSGVYFLRNGNGQPCLYVKAFIDRNNPHAHQPVSIFPTEDPFPLDPKGHGGCVGLGCVLIRREVFDAVPFPWFDLKEGTYGSDMYFWTKVRDAKFDVWVHPGVACGQIDYTVTHIGDYYRRAREDPAFAASGFIIGTDGSRQPGGAVVKAHTAPRGSRGECEAVPGLGAG